MKLKLILPFIVLSMAPLQAQKAQDKDPELEYTEAEPNFYKDPDVIKIVRDIKDHSGIDVVLRRSGIQLPLIQKKIRTYVLPVIGLTNIDSEIRKYPKGFLKMLGVKKLILTGDNKNIFTGQGNIGGVYFPKFNKLFLNLESADLRYALHHELSHVIDDKMGHNFGWKEWTDLNTPGIKYDGSQNQCVITLYSGNAEEEDRAEILTHIMLDPKNRTNDEMIEFWCEKRECIRKKFSKMIEQLDVVFETRESKTTPYWRTVRIKNCIETRR